MNVRLKTSFWLILTGAALLTAGCGGDLPTATPVSLTLPTARPMATTLSTLTSTPTPPPTKQPAPTSSPTSTPQPAGPDDVPMVEIPAGKFIMGLTLEQAETLRGRWMEEYHQKDASITFDRASPQLTAYLDTFKIDKLEVTHAHYAACIDAGVCPRPIEFDPQRADYPIYVSYDEAQTYCRWAGKRLPTEAEWEKAARGTDGRLFPWGDEWEADRVALEISPVGSHPQDSSPYGVLDMAGNIGEWTQSPLVAYPGHANPKLFNADLPVERGALGYEGSIWAGALTADRSYGADVAGFRCVVGGEPQPVADIVVSYEPMVGPPPPTATAVDLSQMVEIPAGSFLRGMSEENLQTYLREYNQKITLEQVRESYHDAMPQRSVYLDRYYIDRFPVTTSQFAEFLNTIGEYRWSCGGWRCAEVDEPFDFFVLGFIKYENKQYSFGRWEGDYPFPRATWNGAEAYCAWRGKRLPTEAEWEKAARGTDGRLYPWGNERDRRVSDHESPYLLAKDPVGSKPYLASPYGVQDLIGISNFGEWVADWYAEDYYSQTDSTHNPHGPAEGKEKVRRGGTPATVAGIPRRDPIHPLEQIFGTAREAAFRCAYTPPGEQ